MKNKAIKLSLKILFHISFVVFVLAQTMGTILLANASVINSALGIQTQIGSGYDGSMYFDTKFKNMNEVNQASLEIIEETMKEGAVLLKNSNSALPLKQGDKVTLYGAASYYSVHTGQGSSSKDGALNNRVTFYQGLTNAGLDVNSELNEWYKNQGASSLGGGNFIGNSGQETQFVVKDINWNSLPSAKTTPADAAIMVLARTAGEAIDLYMDTTMDDGQTRVIVSRDNNNNPSGSVGDNLALTENEKSVLFNLKSLKDQGVISKIIVIMNSASPLQSNFLTDDAYDIDACLWVGTIGTNGANAIGKLLTGEYNPSGRTADTFWAESKYNPVYYNFGSIAYKNSSILKNYFATRGVYNNLYYVSIPRRHI